LGNSSLFLAPAGFSVGLDFLMNIPISLGTAIFTEADDGTEF
jgi:hypothetical protein